MLDFRSPKNYFTTFHKPAIILLVLLASVWLGSRPSSGLSTLAILFIVGLIVLLLLAPRPQWVLLALIPATFLIPYEVGTGTGTAINVSILLLAVAFGFWGVKSALLDRHIFLFPSSINFPAIVFILTVTLSLVGGSIQWVPQAAGKASLFAQIGGWVMLVLPVLALLLAGNILFQVRWLKWLTFTFLALGSLSTLYRWFPFLRQLVPLNFVQGSDTSIFWIFLVSLALGQFLLNKGLPKFTRLWLGMLILAALVLGWRNREWASGIFPPLVAAGVILWLYSWRLGLLAALVALGLAAYVYGDLLLQVVAVNQYSLDTRAATFPILFELLKANPILGLGPSQYYHYTPLYPILGWYVKFNSHNQYMDILLQVGLLGLGVFLWLAVSIWRTGWGLYQKFHRTNRFNFSHAYVAGCLGGLAGMLFSGFLGDWFMPFVYNIGFAGFRSALFGWLFLGGLIALENLVRQEKEQTNRAAPDPP